VNISQPKLRHEKFDDDDGDEDDNSNKNNDSDDNNNNNLSEEVQVPDWVMTGLILLIPKDENTERP